MSLPHVWLCTLELPTEFSRGQRYAVPTRKFLWRWKVCRYFIVHWEYTCRSYHNAQLQSHEFGCVYILFPNPKNIPNSLGRLDNNNLDVTLLNFYLGNILGSSSVYNFKLKVMSIQNPLSSPHKPNPTNGIHTNNRKSDVPAHKHNNCEIFDVVPTWDCTHWDYDLMVYSQFACDVFYSLLYCLFSFL